VDMSRYGVLNRRSRCNMTEMTSIVCLSSDSTLFLIHLFTAVRIENVAGIMQSRRCRRERFGRSGRCRRHSHVRLC